MAEDLRRGTGACLAEDRAPTVADAIQQSPDGVLITNTSGIIEYVNPSFEALTGYRRDEILGRTPRMFRSGAHGGAFYQRLWRVLRSGAPFRAVFIDRKPTGDLVHLEQTIAPVKDAAGNVTHYVATARDVTAKVRADEALRHLNEALEHQAKSIATRLHDEAGQLLTAAYIALADAGRAAPAACEPLRHLRGHLDCLEEQLRRLAHELRPRVLDDLGLVPALTFLAAGVEQRWGVSVAVESSIQARLPPAIETAIYRVAQEALTNVTRHARATRATVRFDHASHAIRCRIDDDGAGFDPRTVLAADGKHGMGLAAIRERVAALGGTFEIVSSCGSGTVLTTTIPLEA